MILDHKNSHKVNTFFKLRFTGTSKKEYHEKGQYFLSLISESETHILYIHYMEWNVKPLFLYILMVMA